MPFQCAFIATSLFSYSSRCLKRLPISWNAAIISSGNLIGLASEGLRDQFDNLGLLCAHSLSDNLEPVNHKDPRKSKKRNISLEECAEEVESSVLIERHFHLSVYYRKSIEASAVSTK